MNNEHFDTMYSVIVEPKYGSKRNIQEDIQLTQHLPQVHSYSIPKYKRVDMTQYDSYSIDPVGCKDADDAFSIYTKNNKLYLAIHIADPTEYIELNSNLWKDIVKRTTTKYPSNRPPIHMMPQDILELSSLQGDEQGTAKNAISVVSEIDPTTYEPLHGIKLLFTTITVKKDHAFSYQSASMICDTHEVLKTALSISETLKAKRSRKTTGIKLNEVCTAYPIYEPNDAYLYEDSSKERSMKQMIAEFAIFANSFVGEYLKIHLNMGIFRTCNATEWLQTLYSGISGDELLQEIITNGIKADYMANVESHDLVGMPEYCHFTSPIRRLSDCICHYLLKYICFKEDHKDPPFSDNLLEHLAGKCLLVTREEKKNQYVDIKFRLLQVMNNMIAKEGKIHITYYLTGYSGLFLNLIICKINDFHVHMSYTLRIRNFTKTIQPKEKYGLVIDHVNCFNQYDEHTIPQLDKHVLSI